MSRQTGFAISVTSRSDRRLTTFPGLVVGTVLRRPELGNDDLQTD
jgi:hypothetical protein